MFFDLRARARSAGFYLVEVEAQHASVPYRSPFAAHGIVEETELQCYVVTGVLVPPRFDEHPAAQSCFEAVADGKAALNDALASINDTTWDAIRETPERELLEARSDLA
ncbi:hypothetical protein LGN22_31385 [Burkholderia cenocepacia]|uniref:Uncharacterized protein n=1 Tax=Burkholderia cenocepacia TaxID=95486 RepID=A0AAW4TN09_9BURK|nr:hypothetical protein [Burkholderia cenocepacia]MCA8383421.1 hypothetical protein [Burkholderia cenocepacia]